MQHDPYKPPVDNQIFDVEDEKRSVWWIVYFVFILALAGFGFISLYTRSESGLPEHISLLNFVIGMIGLAAFALNKKILTPKFWRYFVILDILYSIVYSFVTQVDQSAGMPHNVYLISEAVGWIISVPSYWALILYSSPSNRPWSKAASGS